MSESNSNLINEVGNLEIIGTCSKIEFYEILEFIDKLKLKGFYFKVHERQDIEGDKVKFKYIMGDNVGRGIGVKTIGMTGGKVVILGERLLVESMLRDRMLPLAAELPINFQEEFQKLMENEKSKQTIATMKLELTHIIERTSYAVSVKNKRNKYLERPLRNFKK